MPSRVAPLLATPESRRFARFLIVGVLNTAFGYGVFSAGVLMGLPSHWALAIANIVGVCFNFFTTGRLVFDNSDNGRIARFVLVYLVVYLGNVGLLKAAEALGSTPVFAQLFLLPLVVVASFVLMRAFVFREAGR